MPPRPHLAAALALALAIAFTPRVRAGDVVPLPPPPAGVAPAAPAIAPAPAAPRPAFRWAITAGYDYGFNELLSVKMTDGSKQSLSANEGLFASVGATFLPLLEGRLETQATIGVKGWSINASNGNLTIVMFPIEVLETYRVDPLRLSAGFVFVPGPSTSADGLLASLDGIHFDSSLGLVLQGEWLTPFKNGRGQLSIGPRFVLQKFQVAHGGPVIDANALGFVTSVVFR